MEPPGTAPGSSPVITSAFITIAGEPAFTNIDPEDGDLKGGEQEARHRHGAGPESVDACFYTQQNSELEFRCGSIMSSCASTGESVILGG